VTWWPGDLGQYRKEFILGRPLCEADEIDPLQ
jgi:hypothetical protein